ncbi:response regulator [Salipiger mucosus DSM 16094]|uniref:Response regulator n=1 Tax=Salipiger mucosus DSM 16094 TaxID=1123237 RepID=S9QL52_9RHOB|nr:response regulator [Salipiger mucosus DSM 16094]
MPAILLVEDDDADAKALIRALNKARIANRVHRAVDGVEALSLLREHSALSSTTFITLLDVNLPRMNGHEFLAELRSDPVLKRAVVFVMTTSQDPLDIDAAYDRQVAGYIPKQAVDREFMRLVCTLENYLQIVDLPRLTVQEGS